MSYVTKNRCLFTVSRSVARLTVVCFRKVRFVRLAMSFCAAYCRGWPKISCGPMPAVFVKLRRTRSCIIFRSKKEKQFIRIFFFLRFFPIIHNTQWRVLNQDKEASGCAAISKRAVNRVKFIPDKNVYKTVFKIWLIIFSFFFGTATVVKSCDVSNTNKTHFAGLSTSRDTLIFVDFRFTPGKQRADPPGNSCSLVPLLKRDSGGENNKNKKKFDLAKCTRKKNSIRVCTYRRRWRIRSRRAAARLL